MTRRTMAQSGFAAIEAVLILVIVGIIGGTGYFVWHAKQSTNKSLTASSNATPAMQRAKTTKSASIATDKPTLTATESRTYKTKNHGVSFKYPTGWKLSDTSIGTSDMVQLTAPSGFSATLSISDLGHPSADSPQTVAFYHTIKNASLGDDEYLDYVGSDSAVTGFVYSTSSTNPLDVFQFAGFNLLFYGSKSSESAAAAKADADYQSAEQIAASITLGA